MKDNTNQSSSSWPLRNKDGSKPTTPEELRRAALRAVYKNGGSTQWKKPQ